jgi:hypothetical protein
MKKGTRKQWTNEDTTLYKKNRYHSDPEYRELYLAQTAASYQRRKIKVSATRSRKRAERKLVVLTHYGKDGKLQCCWPDCQETDIDCLTIDHIQNDGHEHRKKVGNGGVYKDIIKNAFPSGFQTLCASHQMKKEIISKRDEGRRENISVIRRTRPGTRLVA